ncbi:MAG: hypothetical protein JWL72_2198 [Ilumatobacteraceae bacterium]|nr:hypothetical protein [Ilumatobacteraceae bacterium]
MPRRFTERLPDVNDGSTRSAARFVGVEHGSPPRTSRVTAAQRIDPLMRAVARGRIEQPVEAAEAAEAVEQATSANAMWTVVAASLGSAWRRWRRASRRWRRARRRVLAALLVLMLPVMWSYARALTGPGNDSLQARTVEWARDNHLGWAVDRLEKWWYSNHQAKIGGTPNLTAAAVVVASAGTATSVPEPLGVGIPALPHLPGHLEPPLPLVSPATPTVPGEGEWTAFGPLVNGAQGAYVTTVRPDAIHTSVLDAVIWFDPTILKFRQYPGLKIPGSPWDRPPHVEVSRQAQLVAAFAGGFRIRDSNGGMILGHVPLVPMRDGGATFTIDDNGVPNIGAWGTDVSNSSTLDSARQSLDPIVVNGAPAPDLTTDPNKKWGFTGPANKSAVWRSGAGVRADGSLIWVGGDGLTVETLAETLVRAGAVRGMQLEINHEWVQLNTYAVGADGTVHGQRLLHGMQHTGDRWLTEDTRDFVAVFSR